MSKFSLYAPKATEPTEPEVDLGALEAFAAGAKERRGAEGEDPPWAPFDPNEKPRSNVSIRLNDYYLKMLQYLAEVQEISQHKILAKQLMPVLKQMALAEFEARRSGHDHRLGHSNLQESQLAKVNSDDAKEGAGRNNDQGQTSTTKGE